jgi:hypothetical protein
MVAAGIVLVAFLQSGAHAQTSPASLLLPEIAGDAGSPLDFSRFSPDASPVMPSGSRVVPLGSLGAPAAVVPLDRLLNGVRATKTVFYAGSMPVHVFGSKSENNLGLTGWFLQLYPEGATNELFFNGVAMSRVLVKFWGSGRAQINGMEFDMHLDINLGDTSSSRLEIDQKKPAGAKISFSAAEIAKGAYATGCPLRLGGTEYRVLYGQNYWTKGEQFGGYTANRSIVFMFSDGKDFSSYSFLEKDIPRDGILISTPPKSLADEKKSPGNLTLGLRLDPAGNLEVYYPIRAQ